MAVEGERPHNRKKNYFLEEGERIPPLTDMGVFSKEGKVIHSMYGKFKQINRFIEMLHDAVSKYPFEKIHIIDFGCGKSYLTFVVYYFLHEKMGLDVHMTGLDLKADVIAQCNATAERYGYGGLKFEVGDIHRYQTDEPVDVVISLHACDTATDYALFHAIRWKTKIILSAPCCQHELNEQLTSDGMAILQRYGVIKERMAALMTDAIRGNLLGCCGYKTQILEFVDLTHTPKNLLIRATRTNLTRAHRDGLRDEVYRLAGEFHLKPTLLRLLEDNAMLVPRH